jgi:hypothetical protein
MALALFAIDQDTEEPQLNSLLDDDLCVLCGLPSTSDEGRAKKESWFEGTLIATAGET